MIGLDQQQNLTNTHTILFKDYVDGVAETDRLESKKLTSSLLGLYGEVGSIMASSKKTHRERSAYTSFRVAAEEEFGDALWYLNAIAKRTAVNLDDVFLGSLDNDKYNVEIATSGIDGGTLAKVYSRATAPLLDDALLALGRAAADLFLLETDQSMAKTLLTIFAGRYTAALHAANLNLTGVIRRNLAKSRGRFLAPDFSLMPIFDEKYEQDEKLPDRFEIHISQRKNGKTYLQWHGVFIGDPLSDNIVDGDGYRYHDVFHLAYASILNWSPVFRSLIKHKRKSNPIVDETEDGGRAIVVEEGLSAWLFSRAKELNFFAEQKQISLDVLKIVQQFVRGYEVEACPLNLWEHAILEGFRIFRMLNSNEGGIVICDTKNRTISYKEIS
jgi:hypothetical protein